MDATSPEDGSYWKGRYDELRRIVDEGIDQVGDWTKTVTPEMEEELRTAEDASFYPFLGKPDDADPVCTDHGITGQDGEGNQAG